ncbi:MAG TPA: excinuclease ABC subunit UvrC [Actinomycetota bacterium]|nr:excinuclease ABC subunit UvrC [Actinomycetota bacterium]
MALELAPALPQGPAWRPRNADIPESSGVYLYRDAQDRVIYVGKAKSLRGRIPNYFTTGLHPRTMRMISEAVRVEWIVTANEVEALQLEVTLIKKHRPRFNVRYRDDKSYPYLAVTLDETIPRALVLRGKKRKGVRYYGPFVHAYAIRDTLDLLLRVFPIRSCRPGVFDRARRANRACLLYDIGRCSGPCVGAVTPEEHRQLIEDFCAFMDGAYEPVLKELQDRMTAAAQALEFEQAARIRDQLAAVRKVIERQQMVTERPEDFDAIAFSGDELEAAFQVFFVRRGRVTGRKGFIVDRVEEMTPEELIASFLEDLYGEDQEVPKEILVQAMPADQAVLQQWLSTRTARKTKVALRVPERGAKRKLLATVEENSREAFLQSRLKRSADFAARSRALNELQDHLGLEEAPLRIECYDISNLGATDVVASMVVFEDALPKKSDYRKFKIRSVGGPHGTQDDFASMGEVIRRRFTRYLEEAGKEVDRHTRFSYRPSLVLIDGGKGQLNRAVEVLQGLGLEDIPVASLAKRYEEVYRPGEAEPRVIPRTSEALYLLQRVRDEAHRFAVGFQRTQRGKRLTSSLLDGLAGVGDVRRKALIRHFGSMKGLLAATPDDIALVHGIGRALAKKIYTALHGMAFEEAG